MTLNPLQDVLESALVFWQDFFHRLHEASREQVQREKMRLQVEACHLSEDDPEIIEAILKIGAAAHAFFAEHEISLLWVQNPLVRPWVLKELEDFIEKFQTLDKEVATAAHIPEQEWVGGEYSHDLSQVVARTHLTKVVKCFKEADPVFQQTTAQALAQQVMAAHDERARHSKQIHAQMQ